METKNLLIFAAGVTVGYFVFREINKKTIVADIIVPPPAPPVPDPKLVECQTMLEAELQVVRPTDVEAFKTQFMTECMAGLYNASI